MAENLSVESPDFDKIRKEAGLETESAIKLLWFVLNQEIRDRRIGVRQAQEQRVGKVLQSAPTTQQNNFDAKGAWVVEFTGSTNFTLTGIRNGVPGRFLVLHNTGSATITVADDSASSDAANRIISNDSANISLAANETLLLQYLSSRWREVSLA